MLRTFQAPAPDADKLALLGARMIVTLFDKTRVNETRSLTFRSANNPRFGISLMEMDEHRSRFQIRTTPACASDQDEVGRAKRLEEFSCSFD
jgi:hypothetical protein